MKRFYITGLPRSRTAWLANFFSTGKVFCHHEAMNGCHSIAEYTERMSMRGYDYVGNSDCGLFLAPSLIDGPLVIIERSIDDVVKSLAKVFNGLNARDYCEHIQTRLAEMDGLRIPFTEIDERLNDIWTHCIGDGFDTRRAEQLKAFNVQLDRIAGDPVSLEVFPWRG